MKLPNNVGRRGFIKGSTAAVTGIVAAGNAQNAIPAIANDVRHTFDGPDSLCHGPEWETLNPGMWQTKNNCLRRRLVNVGDRARSTGFPFHYANQGRKMPTEYDPSQPGGIIYRRDWRMSGDYTIQAEFVYRGDRPEPSAGDDPDWKMYRDGFGGLGLAFGAKSLFESYNKKRHVIEAVWTDAKDFQLMGSGKQKSLNQKQRAPSLQRGDRVRITVDVRSKADGRSTVLATLAVGEQRVELRAEVNSRQTEGFVGISARGLVDFEVTEFLVTPGDNQRLQTAACECNTCYPLGDSLRNEEGDWYVRFVSLFETDGSVAEIRVASQPTPPGGWQTVPVAGRAKIVNHSWRRNTAVVEVKLPMNPADSTMYYTVWKDGVNVTADPRLGSDSVGPGTGLVGDVPASGNYVGRLPRLQAPYKLCGLSCHAITSGLQQRTETGLRLLGGGDVWQFRDQPTVEAYKHFENYNFQIMVWEDDVWYMELVMYPSSTDDAYKIVKHSICGPTSRWQMMRHWNVINPGDHDYGMDDVKGPEQLVVRRVEGVGQDTAYMRRNFQIVHHLVTGAEEVDPLANPKKWRAWRMPNHDFTFVVLDSRLWRSSQDTDIWDDSGWDQFQNLYDRTDPTRSLLGEEQFAWLQQLVLTDSSPLICLTGINGMHTVWTGVNYKGGAAEHIKGPFDQRDRVTADYAGWVKAGADRVIELLGSRSGIVTVYGDVHNGCIMRNVDNRLVECSFGPIGRSGGRSVIPGFGPQMQDFDGRSVDVFALYHKTHANPLLEEHADGEPFYWNFLEMEFDPREADGRIGLRIRNMMDPPSVAPRGGDSLETVASETGRPPSCKLPTIRTLANADVRFTTLTGRPLRGVRSDSDGAVSLGGLVDVQPGERVLMTAYDGNGTDAQVIRTQPLT